MTTVTSARANKLYQVALFTALPTRNRSMVNILSLNSRKRQKRFRRTRKAQNRPAQVRRLSISQTLTNRPVMK